LLPLNLAIPLTFYIPVYTFAWLDLAKHLLMRDNRLMCSPGRVNIAHLVYSNTFELFGNNVLDKPIVDKISEDGG